MKYVSYDAVHRLVSKRRNEFKSYLNMFGVGLSTKEQEALRAFKDILRTLEEWGKTGENIEEMDSETIYIIVADGSVSPIALKTYKSALRSARFFKERGADVRVCRIDRIMP